MADVKTIKAIPSEIMTSAGTGQTTLRGTSASLPYNANLLKRLQTIIGNETYDGNLFDNEGFEPGSVTIEEMQQLLTQVAIRFDNDPNYYTKRDYQYLIWYLCSQLIYCTSDTIDWGEQIEKLIQDIEALHTRINAAFEDISDLGTRIDATNVQINSVNERLKEANDQIDDLYIKSKDANDRIEQLVSRVDNTNIRIDETLQMIDANSDAISDIKDQLKNFNPDKCVLEAGTGIKIEDNIISAKTDNAFTVSNVTIGEYSDGMVIDANTPIVDILKKILQKVVDVIAVNPKVTLSGHSQQVEYGTSVNTGLTIDLTQGYFKPASSDWNGANQSMHYKIDSIGGNLDWTITDLQARASDHSTITEVKTYSNYTVQISEPEVTIPVKSNNEASDVRCNITALTASNSVTITPKYKAFIGGVDAESIDVLDSAKIRAVTNYWLPVTPSSQTLLNGTPTSNNGKQILIACPNCYELESVNSELGTDMTDAFDQKGTVTVKCGEVEVEYNCYLCVVYEECKFQTVKFKKA